MEAREVALSAAVRAAGRGPLGSTVLTPMFAVATGGPWRSKKQACEKRGCVSTLTRVELPMDVHHGFVAGVLEHGLLSRQFLRGLEYDLFVGACFLELSSNRGGEIAGAGHGNSLLLV